MVTISSDLVTNGDSTISMVNWGYSNRIMASLSSVPFLRKANVQLVCRNRQNGRSSTISDICSKLENWPWDMLGTSVTRLPRSVVELKIEVHIMHGVEMDGDQAEKVMNQCVAVIKGKLQLKKVGIEVQFCVTDV